MFLPGDGLVPLTWSMRTFALLSKFNTLEMCHSARSSNHFSGKVSYPKKYYHSVYLDTQFLVYE